MLLFPLSKPVFLRLLTTVILSSKDGLIRLWDRKTLNLAHTLSGHEGPVNAVGLQDGKVVSASGDGKMMLWDVSTGSRIRTFEGHDRGLACIEFKVGQHCSVSVQFTYTLPPGRFNRFWLQ